MSEKSDFEVVLPLAKPQKGAMGKTGDWRVMRPILDSEKCRGDGACLLCWLYCPEASIEANVDPNISDPPKNSKGEIVPEIIYEWCKGCEICVEMCPRKAITLEREPGK